MRQGNAVAGNTGKPRPLRADPDEFRPDPHAGYARCRPLTPLIEFGDGLPYAIRHADVMALMTDPRTRQMETEGLLLRGIGSGALYDFFANTMLLSNPPVHARRRRPAARAFAYRLIDRWRPRIRALVGEMLDGIAAAGEAEFLTAIAAPLPARLTARILGAPREDAPGFASLVYRMSRGLGSFRPEEFPAIEEAAAELTRYVRGLLEARRESPREDFLTDYLARVEEAGTLSEAETLMQIVSLIIAGSDTTRFGLTALFSNLLADRAQWQTVCNDPALAPAAVEEALRFEPPVGSIVRVLVDPLEIGGIALPEGTVLNLSMISAQRDSAVFSEPDRFDIRRDDHPRANISFGDGPHRCLGEMLARAEMEEALRAIASRFPQMRLAGPPMRPRGHTGIRGAGALPVAWG
ncbi:MAG: cytochrome P450 [Alphaproteobacteria bacterium]|nr:MAG: cytochrome P450 [Alphaproteobacteria bacterium]